MKHLPPASMALALAFLLLLPPDSAVAQDGSVTGDSVTAGSKVRVTVEDDGRTTGRLRFLREGNLGLVVGGDSVVREIPVASIERLEVAVGQRSGIAGRALIGAGVGLALGVVLCSDDPNGFIFQKVECYVALPLIGGGLGVLGGALDSTERWKRVPVEGLHLTLGTPPRGGVGLQLALPWTGPRQAATWCE